jgi:hypothetical protein
LGKWRKKAKARDALFEKKVPRLAGSALQLPASGRFIRKSWRIGTNH